MVEATLPSGDEQGAGFLGFDKVRMWRRLRPEVNVSKGLVAHLLFGCNRALCCLQCCWWSMVERQKQLSRLGMPRLRNRYSSC